MTTRARLYLDLALFGALFVAYNPAWTGLAVHEWLCVVAIVPLLFHVVVNWDQTLQILRRFAVIVRATPKVNLVVDAALFVAAVAVTLSGLLISQAVAGALGVTILPSGLWMTVHAVSADLTIGLLARPFRAALEMDRERRRQARPLAAASPRVLRSSRRDPRGDPPTGHRARAHRHRDERNVTPTLTGGER